MAENDERLTRRDVLKITARGAALVGLTAGAGMAVAGLGTRSTADDMVWQIDPEKCVQCERCSTHCVLSPSAVRCVHEVAICHYCNICFGYFDAQHGKLPGAAGQQCPADAIHRAHVSGDHYAYTIDEAKCIGCARCVKGCNRDGNSALFLQVRHNLCLNCSQCSIAEACPSGAFVRVPASRPYLIRQRGRTD